MSAPVTLQRYADKLAGTKFHDTDKLWGIFQSMNKRVSAVCAAESSKGQMNQEVMNAVTAAYDKMRKGSANRGRKISTNRQALLLVRVWHRPL